MCARPLLLTTLLLTACDQTLLGERGVIEFTPDDCGAPRCDLLDDLASDSTLAILLEFHDRELCIGRASLESSDPTIVEVTDETGWITPRFRVRAHAPGRVRLHAVGREYGGIDRTDVIEIEVVAPADIALDVSGAGEPERVDATTDRYRVRAGGEVRIRSRPVTAGGHELMGEVVYTTTLGAELAATVGGDTNLARGAIMVRPPTGTHVITIAMASGAVRTIELVAE